MKKAIICDLDGTLALMVDRKPYGKDIDVSTDTINEPVRYVLDCSDPYNEIIFISGREDTHRKATQEWLDKYGFGKHPLFMRKEGDYRKDSIIKEEIYNAEVKGKYQVLFVLDDRNQVVEFWRSIGLTCFQVAEGNF